MKTMSILGSGILASVAAASLAAYAQTSTSEIASSPKAEGVVDAKGNLRVPEDYRTAYQFLGAWAVADEKNKGSKEMHLVFASPGTIAAYQKNGGFADNSVLVKEVYETATGEMTTGMVSHPKELKGWFVMVRDSKNSHPGNKLWGDGWDWSWFDKGNPLKTTSTDYKVDCQPCHAPA